MTARNTDAIFWSRVNKDGECWEWCGARSRQGYGRFRMLGVWYFSHRYSWIQANGKIQDGLCVCHKCDNPPCVRPDHLFVGTNADNTRDRCLKKRSAFGDRNGTRTRPDRVVRGSRVNTAVLTEGDVRLLRLMRSRCDTSYERLGRIFGCGHQTAHNVVSRKSWSHVPDFAQWRLAQ